MRGWLDAEDLHFTMVDLGEMSGSFFPRRGEKTIDVSHFFGEKKATVVLLSALDSCGTRGAIQVSVLNFLWILAQSSTLHPFHHPSNMTLISAQELTRTDVVIGNASLGKKLSKFSH